MMKQTLGILNSISPNRLQVLAYNLINIDKLIRPLPTLISKISLYRRFKFLKTKRLEREINANRKKLIIMFDPSVYLDDEKVAKLPVHLQPKYLTNKQIMCINRLKAMNEVRTSNEDTASVKVRMATLSSRVERINQHIEKFPKDIQSKFFRRKVKFIRKTIMRYAKLTDFTMYHQLRKQYEMSELDVCIDKYTWKDRAKIFKKKKKGMKKPSVTASSS